MANSVSLDAFVRGVKRLWPGATVWTKGDTAHQGSTSDHNNDDTAGSKSEQTDADNIPEVRAADIPLLGGVTMAKLDELRVRLTTRPANQMRLRYVILRQDIWRKRNGWKREDYNGEYHGHLHASLDVADDANKNEWDIGPAGLVGGDPVSNFMIQVNGQPTIFLSDGFKYRGIASWEAFLTFRDSFKWPYIVVPNVNELRYRAGRTEEEASAVQALLSDAQVGRLEAAAKAGALDGAGGLDLDALRVILDDESISETEIAERFGGKA